LLLEVVLVVLHMVVAAVLVVLEQELDFQLHLEHRIL
jgi:hypothetical protein